MRQLYARTARGHFSVAGLHGNIFHQSFFLRKHGGAGPEKEWKYRLEKFCDAYRAVKAEGDKRGLDVFFGFEYTVPHSLDPIANNAGCDFLVFGVDEKWLENYGGDVESCPTRQYLNRIREAGGTVIQAHPYRLEERYMDHICLMPDCVDGVEVINTSPNTKAILLPAFTPIITAFFTPRDRISTERTGNFWALPNCPKKPRTSVISCVC